jgi:hypothetical protein
MNWNSEKPALQEDDNSQEEEKWKAAMAIWEKELDLQFGAEEKKVGMKIIPYLATSKNFLKPLKTFFLQ